MKLLRDIKLSFLGLIIVASQALSANQSIDPIAACDYLTGEKFKGSMEYTENEKTGKYSCASLRKPIDKGEPLGSDLKYMVKGNESEATQVSLWLRMNSSRISTPVLREFQKYSNVLYQKAFGNDLPAEISRSMLSAIRGEWHYHGHKISLSRVHDKALVYELIFSIEKYDRQQSGY